MISCILDLKKNRPSCSCYQSLQDILNVLFASSSFFNKFNKVKPITKQQNKNKTPNNYKRYHKTIGNRDRCNKKTHKQTYIHNAECFTSIGGRVLTTKVISCSVREDGGGRSQALKVWAVMKICVGQRNWNTFWPQRLIVSSLYWFSFESNLAKLLEATGLY